MINRDGNAKELFKIHEMKRIREEGINEKKRKRKKLKMIASGDLSEKL